jgi:hypothetical protein
MGGGQEILVPKLERQGGVSKKGKANLDDVLMFMLSYSILLMGMRARDVVSNANTTKAGTKPLILATPIRLDDRNLPIQQLLYKALEFLKEFAE